MPPPPPVQSTAEKDVHTLASGVGVVLAGRTLGRFLRLLVDITLARILAPTAFGQYAIGWTITRIVTLVSPLGLDDGVIRFGSLHRHRDKAVVKGVIQESIWMSLATGLLLGVVFYLAAPWLGESKFHSAGITTVFKWFALTFPLISCLRVAAAATQISQRMKFSVYAEEVSQSALALILIIVFYFFEWGLNGALAAIVLSWGVSLVLGLHYVRHLFPEIVSKQVQPKFLGKELILFSLPANLAIVCGMILIWVDRLFVGYFRSAAEAGTYHAASQLSIALAIILSAFGAMMSPMTADLYHQGKVQRLEEMFRVSTKWSLYLSIPVFLIMCAVPSQIMTVAFGKDYVIGAAVLPILGFGQLLNAGTGTTGPVLVMTGYQKAISLLTAATMVTNIILGFLLVPRWGMLGAAIGTAFTVGMLSIASILLIKRLLGIWPYDKRYLKGLIATSLAGAALLLLRLVPLHNAVLALAVNIIVAMGLFAGTLAILGLDREDREFVKLIIARIR